jgi:hypothetical protein
MSNSPKLSAYSIVSPPTVSQAAERAVVDVPLREAVAEVRLVLRAGDRVHVRRVELVDERVRAEARRQRRLAVALRLHQQPDLVDAVAGTVAAPELAQERMVVRREPIRLPGRRALVVAQEAREEPLEPLEAVARAELVELALQVAEQLHRAVLAQCALELQRDLAALLERRGEVQAAEALELRPGELLLAAQEVLVLAGEEGLVAHEIDEPFPSTRHTGSPSARAARATPRPSSPERRRGRRSRGSGSGSPAAGAASSPAALLTQLARRRAPHRAVAAAGGERLQLLRRRVQLGAADDDADRLEARRLLERRDVASVHARLASRRNQRHSTIERNSSVDPPRHG